MKTHTYRATVVLTDEQGNIVSEAGYSLPACSFNIDEVEASVTEFRKKALPQMESDMLAHEQAQLCKKKRAGCMKNGKDSVEIHTINGNFPFKLQRYCTMGRKAAPSLLAKNPGGAAHTYRSSRLELSACRYAVEMPYATAARVLEDLSGCPQICGQEIENVVKRYAAQISMQESDRLSKGLIEQAPLLINTDPGIYDKDAPEILTIADGISVKEQKAERDCVPVTGKSFVSTTIVGIQQKDGAMKNIVESYDKENELALGSKIAAVFHQEYKEVPEGGLPIVAINDGAKNLRSMYMLAFGILPFMILDWYHLCRKVRAFITMSGMEKEKKQELAKKAILLLWNGEHAEAAKMISGAESSRTGWKDDLTAYITKHKDEIIDYRRRKAAGKKIGSGYIESTVNAVVGRRQKSKGMSWSEDGCHALAILKNHFSQDKAKTKAA